MQCDVIQVVGRETRYGKRDINDTEVSPGLGQASWLEATRLAEKKLTTANTDHIGILALHTAEA